MHRELEDLGAKPQEGDLHSLQVCLCLEGAVATAEPSEADAAIGKLDVEIAIPLHKLANNLSKK